MSERLSTIRSLIAALGVVWFAVTAAQPLRAQEIPEAVQEELQRRGMTPEEARQQARQLGIDLTNPEQAARRARELGVPEETIQAMLKAVQEPQAPVTAIQDEVRGIEDTQPPVLDGFPFLSPPSIRLGDALSPVKARVSLRDAGLGIQDVRMVLVAARKDLGPTMADTLDADQVRQVRGDAHHGTWEALFYLHPEVTPGVWALVVRASDRANNVRLIETQASMRVLDKKSQDADTSAAQSYYGYETFRNVPEAFMPGGITTAGPGYVVGPGDELRLAVWGGAEFQYDLEVDPEGRIFIPKAGQLTVAGRSLDDLRRNVRVWLSRSYAGLVDEPPSVFMDLTATRLKPLQVFVLGEVPQPGGYTVPSGSSIFGVLYSVGGPTTSGSLRDVRVIRGTQVASVDLYEYLLKGYASSVVQIQTGDHILIPRRGKTVAVEGAVGRPAIYELKKDETFEDLIAFAGGLQAEAYTSRFQVDRIIPFAERRDPAVARTVLDFDLRDVLTGRTAVRVEDGDRVSIFSIVGRESLAGKSHVRASVVSGAVYQPGRYEIDTSVRTVRDLLEAAHGLTGEAYREKAELVRLNSDLQQQIVGLDLRRVLEDDPTHNLVLRPQDSLHVYFRAELEAQRTVSISGQIRTPGEYPLLAGMTVADLLERGGGLRDAVFLNEVFLERADLVRVNRDGRSTEIMPFDLQAALDGRGVAGTALRAGDQIVIYEAAIVEPVRPEERFVEVSGAVKNPGQYIYHDNMTLEDVLMRAGGFREDAFTQRAEVTRSIWTETNEGQQATQIDVPLGGSSQLGATGGMDIMASLDTATVLEGARTFHLQHRDHVFIRQNPVFVEQATVSVLGEVAFPGEYTLLRQNETLGEVIRRAGGVLPTGYEKGGKLLRGGQIVVTYLERAIAGDPRYNVVLHAGDEILIPPQPNTVAVRGNVALEGLFKHVPGKRVSYYIDQAGGVLEDTDAIYVTQASGARYRVNKRFILNMTPRVDDGAGILVTQQPPKDPSQKIDAGKLVTDTMGILASTLTIIVLGRRALD